MNAANQKGFMLVTEDGKVTPHIYWDMGVVEGVANIKHELEPPDTRLITVEQDFTESIKGSLNYDLIYSGTDGAILPRILS